MKKRLALISVLLALVIAASILGGCASQSGASASLVTADMAAPQAAPAAPQMTGFAERAKLAGENYQENGVDYEMPVEEPMDYAADDAVDAPAGGGDGGIAGPAVNTVIDARKIIKNVNLHLQTMTFDSGVDSISAIAERFGGYVQDSYVEGRDMYAERGSRYANFTVRIPSDRLDGFVNSLGGEFNVVSKGQNSQDITDVYFDSKARLDALKVQEERLTAMLEKAEELEYLLQVEKELMNVRYELESLTASLARMDSYVSLSTVNIQLYEVVKYENVEDIPVNFGERIASAFGGSWVAFADFMQDLAVFLVSALPFILLIAVAAVIVVAIVRRIRKRRGKKEKSEQHAASNASEDNGGDSK